MSKPNPFQHFWRLGYRTLIPIIPASGPAAGYAAKSDNYLGKAPGFFDEAIGMWRGMHGWQNYGAVEADLVRWFEQGANVGLRLEDLLAIDIDAGDPATADKVEQMTLAALGPSSCRIGRAPRRMLLYRLSEPMRYTAISFDQGGETEKIEFATGKRQMVIYGTHAKTKKPYAWPREPVARDELSVVAPWQVDALIGDLRAVLPPSALAQEGSSTDRSKVNQNALRGPAEHVRAAIEALPNNSNLYPTRDDYIRVGVALKAALEDENEAFELWCDWAAKYDDGGQPALWGKDWRGIKPPYEIGAMWLYAEAEKKAGWTGTADAIVATFGDPVAFEAAKRLEAEKAAAAEIAPLFPEILPNPFEQSGGDVFEMLSVTDIMALPPPRYLIDRHLLEQSTCIVYGDPGAGKSFLTLDWSLHLASGAADWHGDEIEAVERPAVVYIAGEGVSGYQTRIRAWLARHPEADTSLPGFRLIHQKMNFTSPELVAKLVRSIKQVCGRATLIVVDTVAKSIAGAEENSTKEMGLFVDACVDISKHFHCAVIGVHHTNKAGGMRGSSAVPGGVDTIFKLERKKGSNTGYLMCEKQKDGPGEWTEPFQLETVCVGVDHKGKPVSSLVVSKEAAEVRVASTQAAMLDALYAAWKEGRPWSDQPRSKDRFAPRIMSQRFDVSASLAQEILSGWLAAGVVVVDTMSAKSKTKGLRRVQFDAVEEPQNPFD